MCVCVCVWSFCLWGEGSEDLSVGEKVRAFWFGSKWEAVSQRAAVCMPLPDNPGKDKAGLSVSLSHAEACSLWQWQWWWWWLSGFLFASGNTVLDGFMHEDKTQRCVSYKLKAWDNQSSWDGNGRRAGLGLHSITIVMNFDYAWADKAPGQLFGLDLHSS